MSERNSDNVGSRTGRVDGMTAIIAFAVIVQRMTSKSTEGALKRRLHTTLTSSPRVIRYSYSSSSIS